MTFGDLLAMSSSVTTALVVVTSQGQALCHPGQIGLPLLEKGFNLCKAEKP